MSFLSSENKMIRHLDFLRHKTQSFWEFFLNENKKSNIKMKSGYFLSFFAKL